MKKKSFGWFAVLLIVLLTFTAPLSDVSATKAADEETGTDSDLAPLILHDNDQMIPDQYLIVLKPEVNITASAASIQSAIESVGGSILYFYSKVLNGYSAIIPAESLNWLRSDPSIAYIESDSLVFPSGLSATQDPDGSIDATQTYPTWNLDRIDQRYPALNNQYNFDNQAPVVHAYIIDSGILGMHVEFGVRVQPGTTFVYDDRGTEDCSGHGTHVAGLIGGTEYGVAKRVLLHPVRVFGCTGGTDWSTILSAMDWIAANHIKPAVVNMSFGGSANATVDDAVTALIQMGIPVVVEAGDGSIDACSITPARVPNAITVAAIDTMDVRSVFSNFGSCVDIFAPGTSIQSAWHTSYGATAIMNSTSSAAAQVTGGVALLLQANNTANPGLVQSYIKNTSTRQRVIDPGPGSTNKILFTRLIIPTPLHPYSTITETSPTYLWTKVMNATGYKLELYRGYKLVYTKLLDASICDNKFCTATPPDVLGLGSYKWRVQAYLNNEWKPFSAPFKYFTLTTVGFEEYFNGEMDNWNPKGSIPWGVNNAVMYTDGVEGHFANVYYKMKRFFNFDYSAMVKRTIDDSAANFLLIRYGEDINPGNNAYYPGYAFGYTNSGYFSIWRRNADGSENALQPWTFSPAIKSEDWNTLRIYVSDTTFKFYINDVLVSIKTDVNWRTGWVGLQMYKSLPTGSQFLVDWAKLNVISIAAMNDDIVSPEQEELNRAALESGMLGTSAGFEID